MLSAASVAVVGGGELEASFGRIDGFRLLRTALLNEELLSSRIDLKVNLSGTFWSCCPNACTSRGSLLMNSAFGSNRPEDGFRIVNPGIRVFDGEEKSVVQLLDSGCFLGCWWLFGFLLVVADAPFGPRIALSGGNAAGRPLLQGIAPESARLSL